MTRKSMKWMAALLVVAGVGVLSSETASAAWGYGSAYPTNGYGYQSYGNTGYRIQNHGHHQNRGYAQPRYNSYNYFGVYGNRQYRNSAHFDYSPPTVTRHGNHLDRTPGHYDLNRNGHYSGY